MIKVIDSIMGSGKTSYMVQEINSNPDKRYVYITPYLEEVQRIKNHCLNFEEPKISFGEAKLDSLNNLLIEGKNVVSTHALFKITNRETREALKRWDYILVIDEVMEVVSNEEFKKDDLPMILNSGVAHVDKDSGYLVWDKKEYDGVFYKIKRLCETRSVFVIDNIALVWVFPATIFSYFSDIYICTYMFDAQILRYYLDMHYMEYHSYRVVMNSNKYELVERSQDYTDNTNNIKIRIHQGKKNDIGTFKDNGKKDYHSLSCSWYDRASQDILKRMKKNMVGFFKNDLHSPSDRNLWTAFKSNQEDLKASPYTKGFLACNARAINTYRHKTNIAYVINKFINPYIIKFFALHKIAIGKEQTKRHALSELLQFLFRSALRDGHEVNLYIPSVRMRQVLQDWLGLPHSD